MILNTRFEIIDSTTFEDPSNITTEMIVVKDTVTGVNYLLTRTNTFVPGSDGVSVSQSIIPLLDKDGKVLIN